MVMPRSMYLIGSCFTCLLSRRDHESRHSLPGREEGILLCNEADSHSAIEFCATPWINQLPCLNQSAGLQIYIVSSWLRQDLSRTAEYSNSLCTMPIDRCPSPPRSAQEVYGSLHITSHPCTGAPGCDSVPAMASRSIHGTVRANAGLPTRAHVLRPNAPMPTT